MLNEKLEKIITGIGIGFLGAFLFVLGKVLQINGIAKDRINRNKKDLRKSHRDVKSASRRFDEILSEIKETGDEDND